MNLYCLRNKTKKKVFTCKIHFFLFYFLTISDFSWLNPWRQNLPHYYFFLFHFCSVLKDRVSLCSSECPGVCDVDQSELKESHHIQFSCRPMLLYTKFTGICVL